MSFFDGFIVFMFFFTTIVTAIVLIGKVIGAGSRRGRRRW